MARTRFVAALAAPLLAFGCGGQEGQPLLCSGVSYSAISIEIRGVSEPPPSGFSEYGATAEGWVEDGDFVDSLRVSGFGEESSGTSYVLSAALERPGEYSVHVRKPGYEPWDATNVRAPAGECSVSTATLVAELSPL